MITLRRANERHHSRRQGREVWLTFYAQNRTDPLADGFGTLETLNEDRVPPGARVPLQPARDAAIITYVIEGALAQKDTMSCCSGVIHAGEFQLMTTGRNSRRSERNASRTDWAHVFRISLHSTEPGLKCSHKTKRFSAAERQGVLCVVASPDGRNGSLRIRQDALIYSAMLDPGQHLIHELSPGRRAWLHMVRGEATLGDEVLIAGDGVGFRAERAVSFTARTEGEVLLLELRDELPTSPKDQRIPESVAPFECCDDSSLDAWEEEGGATRRTSGVRGRTTKPEIRVKIARRGNE
jgi:redox-sensitive bicupin YhaK (pirin superfamily)